MEFDEFPCSVLVTDASGKILRANAELLAVMETTAQQLLQQAMENLFAPASRMFLQTHVWPMLLRDDHVHEIHLKISNTKNRRIPVMVNCKKRSEAGVDSYVWVFFVANERSKFEEALLEARHVAESAALALKERKAFIKTITDAIPGMVAYWYKHLRCRFINRSDIGNDAGPAIPLLGTSMQDIIGQSLFTLNESHIRGVLAGHKQTFERTLPQSDGSLAYTLSNYIPDLDLDGSVNGFFALDTDITPVKNAEFELRLAASIFDSTAEGIMVTDGGGIILSVNPAFSAITGYSNGEAVGRVADILKSDRHDEMFHAAIAQAISEHGRWEGEIWSRRQDGSIFLTWQSITIIRSDCDEPVCYVAIFNDISKLWEKNEDTRYLAFHDLLTGLPNRALLIDRMVQLIARIDREQRNVAVMFLDLDGFKAVNDTLGHEAGDDLLIVVARRLVAQVRSGDTVARLGGDEFVVMLNNPASTDEVARIAGRIVKSMNLPIHLGKKTVQVGVSTGIAMYAVDGTTPTQLLKNADGAMYLAKAAGKNTFRFCPHT
ncbi:MAG: diguanylate cyclase (GGDEF)-like protein/PAS domain S-box-containing protein [Janthinobacterium sp.]|jgi:diguanylate cyclase (GGDEF)-like protein/PAS domain S-box-containing protein